MILKLPPGASYTCVKKNLCVSSHGPTAYDKIGSREQRTELILLLSAKIFTSSLQKVWSTWKIHRDLTCKSESSQNGRFLEEMGEGGTCPLKTKTSHLKRQSLNICYLKKIENYQQTLYVITKNNGKSKNRDSINTWISRFYSFNSWSDKA